MCSCSSMGSVCAWMDSMAVEWATSFLPCWCCSAMMAAAEDWAGGCRAKLTRVALLRASLDGLSLPEASCADETEA